MTDDSIESYAIWIFNSFAKIAFEKIYRVFKKLFQFGHHYYLKNEVSAFLLSVKEIEKIQHIIKFPVEKVLVRSV